MYYELRVDYKGCCYLCGDLPEKHVRSKNSLIYCPSDKFRMALREDLYRTSLEAQLGELLAFVESVTGYNAYMEDW